MTATHCPGVIATANRRAASDGSTPDWVSRLTEEPGSYDNHPIVRACVRSGSSGIVSARAATAWARCMAVGSVPTRSSVTRYPATPAGVRCTRRVTPPSWLAAEENDAARVM